MNSKEALEKLFADLKQFEEHFVGCVCNDTKEEHDLIKKDLEILEILKKHHNANFLEVSPNYFVGYSIYENNEDFKKVKEWLEE